MFRVLVQRHLYDWADEQTGYRICDRYSFCCFLALNPEGKISDTCANCLLHEWHKAHDLIDELRAELARRAGSVLLSAPDAARPGAHGPVAIERNPKEDNEKTNAGKLHDNWQYKLIRHFEVTPTFVHDNQVVDVLSIQSTRVLKSGQPTGSAKDSSHAGMKVIAATFIHVAGPKNTPPLTKPGNQKPTGENL